MSADQNILLVEDNRMDIELTIDAFEQNLTTSKVYVAETGEVAIDYLLGRNSYADRSKYPLPDLILLDLKMPGMSGQEILKKIKTTTDTKKIPVIVLTSSQEHHDLKECYNNGANSYILKPVSYEGFLDVIRKVDEYWFQLNISAPK